MKEVHTEKECVLVLDLPDKMEWYIGNAGLTITVVILLDDIYVLLVL